MNFRGVGRDSVASPMPSGSHDSHEEEEGGGVSGVDVPSVFERGDEVDSTASPLNCRKFCHQ